MQSGETSAVAVDFKYRAIISWATEVSGTIQRVTRWEQRAVRIKAVAKAVEAVERSETAPIRVNSKHGAVVQVTTQCGSSKQSVAG